MTLAERLVQMEHTANVLSQQFYQVLGAVTLLRDLIQEEKNNVKEAEGGGEKCGQVLEYWLV